jgi:hypothetical protein
LHALGGAFTFPTWVLGVFLFSLSARRDLYWRSVSRRLLVLSAGIIGVFALAIVSLLFLGFAGCAAFTGHPALRLDDPGRTSPYPVPA